MTTSLDDAGFNTATIAAPNTKLDVIEDILNAYLAESAKRQPAMEALREIQGGFAIGDQVEVVGKYASDWSGTKLYVCEIRQRQHCIDITTREEDRWDGLTDGWQPEDLRLVSPTLDTIIEGQPNNERDES